MRALFITVLLLSSTAFGFEKTFLDEAAVAADIKNVHMEVYDMARTELGCTYDICYRMEVYVNDVLVARWATSPGDPNNDADFNGVNTPKYDNRSLNKSRLMGSGYVSGRGDAMPYAMFILGSKGQDTGFAVHAGNVTGQKESHGCIRLEYANAQLLNSWVKEGKKNGGALTITTHHTTD